MKNFRTRADIERDLAEIWRQEDLAHEMARWPHHLLRAEEKCREAQNRIERLRGELAQLERDEWSENECKTDQRGVPRSGYLSMAIIPQSASAAPPEPLSDPRALVPLAEALDEAKGAH